MPNTFIPIIKSFFQDIPKPLGKALSFIPFGLRPAIGKAYSSNQKRIESFASWDIENKKLFILAKVKETVETALQIPFYKELYAAKGICLEDIRAFSDIAELPIINKEMLRFYPLEKRSNYVKGRYITNTGGSSGTPLDFYITPRLIPREWAHMHTIWGKLGYKQSMLKLGFGGRNIGQKTLVYDGLRHGYTINVYKGFHDILPELRRVLGKERFNYLHGYPSALAEFAKNCETYAPDVVDILRTTLNGAFLASEYPAPFYRDRIEEIFRISTVSWYGHTERAILAWELSEKYLYHPFQTYGYCEVIPNEKTGGWRLIGTSYGNFASPFIRYDTGDDVEPLEIKDSLLVSFRIRSGRLGEFVLDRRGVKIPLTALVFGRHHRLFDVAKFIQVRQAAAGEMTVIVTPIKSLPPNFKIEEWFDSKGLDMQTEFEIVDNPILTPLGKVTLKVN